MWPIEGASPDNLYTLFKALWLIVDSVLKNSQYPSDLNLMNDPSLPGILIHILDDSKQREALR